MAKDLPAFRRYLCDGEALKEGGAGFCFKLKVSDGRTQPAFVVRHKGKVYGYLNQCPHEGLELDWVPGQFFDSSKQVLICAAHGAVYDPKTGGCLGGPCQGQGLFQLVVEELQGKVYLCSEVN